MKKKYRYQTIYGKLRREIGGILNPFAMHEVDDFSIFIIWASGVRPS
jgi:hypothetical protein